MTRHVDERHLLWPHHHEQIAPDEAARVADHLARCARCRRRYEAVRVGLDALTRVPLPLVPAPPTLWSRVEAALDAAEGAVDKPAHRRRSSAGFLVRLLPARPAFSMALTTTAALLLVLIGGATALFVSGRTPFSRPDNEATAPPRPSWAVATLDDEPRQADNPEPAMVTTRLAEGERLQTGQTSRARLEVDGLGHVEIAPRSRVRLVAAKMANGQRRLALERGTLHATIVAPPRLFVVETPSADAVDLGCAYTLSVNESGASVLRVTAGYVALEGKGRSPGRPVESFVPAGAVCTTRPGVGPGTPRFADAPPALRAALDRWDFAGGGAPALRATLNAARAKDSLTLWHLLGRIALPSERALVYDRLARLAPPPPGVTRAGILSGDAAMRLAWKNHLLPEWASHGGGDELSPSFGVLAPFRPSPSPPSPFAQTNGGVTTESEKHTP